MNHFQWSQPDHSEKLNESLLTWIQANIAPIWSHIHPNESHTSSESQQI